MFGVEEVWQDKRNEDVSLDLTSKLFQSKKYLCYALVSDNGKKLDEERPLLLKTSKLNRLNFDAFCYPFSPHGFGRNMLLLKNMFL